MKQKTEVKLSKRVSTLLFIEASSDIDKNEKKQIVTIAKLYGLNVVTRTAKTVNGLHRSLQGIMNVDYLYLATHACTEWFNSDDGKLYMRWEDFAMAICGSQCLAKESKILLGCCRGGHGRVANTLFAYCTDIEYVFGPRWTVTPVDLVIGFHCVLYNSEIRREQPNVSVARASSATGYDFYGYDRAEVEDEWERSGYPYHLRVEADYVEYMPSAIIHQLIRRYLIEKQENDLSSDAENSLKILETELTSRER